MVANKIQGSIVLIASMSGSIANRVSLILQNCPFSRELVATNTNPQGLTCSAYNTSKAAVHQLCRSMAQEIGVHGIRINTLSPGVSISPFFPRSFFNNTRTDTIILVHPHSNDRRPPSRRTRSRKDLDGGCTARTSWSAGRLQSACCVFAFARKQFHDWY